MIAKFLEKIKFNKQKNSSNKECLKHVRIKKSDIQPFKMIDIRILNKNSNLIELLRPYLIREATNTTLGFRHKINLNDFLVYTIEEIDNETFYKITRLKMYEGGIENCIVLMYNKKLNEFDKSLASHLSSQSIYEKYEVTEYKLNSYKINEQFQINILQFENQRPSEIEICYNTAEDNTTDIKDIFEYMKNCINIDLEKHIFNTNNIVRICD